MTRSQELIQRTIAAASATKDRDLAAIMIELAKEYEIAIAQNMALETAIHALCKRIDELPCPK